MGIDLTARWRLIGPSNVDRSSTNPQLHAPFYLSDAHIPGYNYIDLSASMPVTSAVDVRLGVNNLADKQPPVIGFAANPLLVNGNMAAGIYDTLGRYIFAGVTVKY